MPSYYELLGVSPEAPREEIRKAYLQLAHKYHPDAGGSKKDEEKLKEINAAYHCLKNPKQRLQYDLGIYRPHGVSPPSGAPGSTKRAGSKKSAKARSSRGRTQRHGSREAGSTSNRAHTASPGAGRSQTRTRGVPPGAGAAGFAGSAHARSYRPGAGPTSTAFHDNLRNIRFGEAAGDDERAVVGDPMHDVFWTVSRAVSAICLLLSVALCMWAMGGLGVLPGIVIGILAGEALGYLAVSSLAVFLQIMGWWRPGEHPEGDAEFDWGWMDVDDQ